TRRTSDLEQMTVKHWVPCSSPGRGAKFKSPDASPGAFVSPPPGLSPGTASQVIRPCGPHPFGAALKRVRLRRRVQVAEPNSKALTQVGAFSFHPPLDSHQGLRPRLFGPAGLTPSGPR